MNNYESVYRTNTKSLRFDSVKYEYLPFQVMLVGFLPSSYQHVQDMLRRICSHCYIQHDDNANWLYASMDNVDEFNECLKLNMKMISNYEMIAVRPSEQKHFSNGQQNSAFDKCCSVKLSKQNIGIIHKLLTYLFKGWI